MGKIVESLASGDILLTASLDRLGRSTLDCLLLTKLLLEKGIKLFAIRENLSFDGSITSEILITVLSMVSSLERRFISDRTKAGLQRVKKYGSRSGKSIGRPKGSVGKSKLDDHLEEIESLYQKGIDAGNLSRVYKCTWQTMTKFIKTRKLSRIKDPSEIAT